MTSAWRTIISVFCVGPKKTAARHPALVAALAQLPMFTRYRLGDLHVGVVHGDAESLAGWRFDVGHLDNPLENDWRTAAFTAAQVDVFASSHTCLPAIRRFAVDDGKLVANNGAAGMPNFSGTGFGILTRISRRPSPQPPLYGACLRGVFIDALPIHYDRMVWQTDFMANWPAGSPAWESYFQQVHYGPDYAIERAASPCPVSLKDDPHGGTQ